MADSQCTRVRSEKDPPRSPPGRARSRSRRRRSRRSRTPNACRSAQTPSTVSASGPSPVDPRSRPDCPASARPPRRSRSDRAQAVPLVCHHRRSRKPERGRHGPRSAHPGSAGTPQASPCSPYRTASRHTSRSQTTPDAKTRPQMRGALTAAVGPPPAFARPALLRPAALLPRAV